MEDRFDIADNGIVWGFPLRGKSVLELTCKDGAALKNDFVPAELEHPSGKALALSLARLGEVLEQSWAELAPHKLCSFIYDISNRFNSFYHDNKIISEENEELKKAWIALISLTYRALDRIMELLAVTVPEKM